MVLLQIKQLTNRVQKGRRSTNTLRKTAVETLKSCYKLCMTYPDPDMASDFKITTF